MRQLLLAATFLLGTVGCVGGIGGVGDDGGDDGGGDDAPPAGLAKQMYEEDVYPIMTAQCGAGCHLVGSATSTPFISTTVDQAYLTVTGYNSVVGNYTQAAAGIWTKVVPGPHNARTYTADQQAAITAWLAQEVTERQNGNSPPTTPGGESPGQVSERLVTQWMSCLRETDFLELRFGEAWSNQGSGEGNCEVCHETGYKGMIANDDNATMYQVLSTQREYMLFFFLPNVIDLSMARMEASENHFIQLGLRQPPHQEHPQFDANQANNGLGTAPLEVLRQLTLRTQGYVAAAGTANCAPIAPPPPQ
jgi:hypothetical protein